MKFASWALALLLTSPIAMAQTQTEDPYLWLEDVTGEKALAWAKSQNAKSQSQLEGKPGFKALHDRLLGVYNSRERIPNLTKLGAHYYNLWQDAANPRGIWRRTSLEEFRKPEPKWETVLDLDKLSADEKQMWVFKGADCLYPGFKRCLVSLSRAGADAVEIREFDTEAKAFVKDGFFLPESKGGVAWRSSDFIYASRDFGPGTMTRSGYPRVLKLWRRGQTLAQALVVHTAAETDVGVWPVVVHEKGRRYDRFTRVIDTRMSEHYIQRDRQWVALDVPRDTDVTTADEMLLVRLRTDWQPAAVNFKAGSLLSTDLIAFLRGGRDFQVVFEPTERVSLQAFTFTKNIVVLDLLDNVQGRLVEARLQGGKWVQREVAVPAAASIGIGAVDRLEDDRYWMTVTSFLEPTTLYLAQAGSDAREKLKSLPAFFDAKGLKVEQYLATSKDGTRVPYFVVMREGTTLDGSNPTILYGYGGFEQAMTPAYSGTIGSAWLEQGGIWVLSNIRGGGEFGPAWHLAARREGRQKAHDDFIAVGEDLIARKITSPRHLGIMGGSQGGLLVGAAFTQRPELFRAVVCSVPLLDMKRFNKLLAGASWMGEYGNPDVPEDWAFISKYSPYQNVERGKKYPKVLFTTSTRDDRVHPGHARKMAAKMNEHGHDILYFEYMEGGHAAGTNPAQQAYTWSLVYAFFLDQLK